MKVYFVGAGPGDPDLITVRGRNLLERAEVLIYTGSLVPPVLVELSPAPMKRDSHGMQREVLADMMEHFARQGRRVVRLHSGDPSLYGAVLEQIRELERRGVEAEIVPGVSSLFGASAALRTQLTLAGIAETLIVTRPAGRTLEKDDLPELSRFPATLAIFLGTERLEEITAKLRCAPTTPAAVVYHATWPDQKVVRGTVTDIARKAREAGIRKTALLIVGDVVEAGTVNLRGSVLYS